MCLYVQEGNNKKASLYAHLPFTKCHYLYNTLFNAADCMKFGCLLGGWMDGWVEAVPLQAADRQAGWAANRPQRNIQQGGDTVRDQEEEGGTDRHRNKRRWQYRTGTVVTAAVGSTERRWGPAFSSPVCSETGEGNGSTAEGYCGRWGRCQWAPRPPS